MQLNKLYRCAMLIGRKQEIQVLQSALRSEESAFVAVYGRRRVGKTFLVRQVLQNEFLFQHTGVANSSKRIQLKAWAESLRDAGLQKTKSPADWMDAFAELKQLIKASRKRKKVIFLDEMPWMDTQASGFIPALEHFWNAWASSRTDIVLIVCGSATSWIIRKVIQNHGGLHNRVTHKIHLQPFTLRECELYARYRHLQMTRKQIAEAYMIMGGVPYYWSCLQPSRSLAQNVDNLFFSPDGELYGEYEALYASLFKHPDKYIDVIEALTSCRYGLTRKEIAQVARLDNNGALSIILQDLEYCGFIRCYLLPNRKNGAVYQLMDSYTLFYHIFIRHNTKSDTLFWSHSQGTSLYTTWCGLSFERVAYMHTAQIKQALGISGVLTQEYAWRNSAAQIDLLIDRQDGVINLCEMKFYSSAIANLETISDEMERKRAIYIENEHPKKALFNTLVTTYTNSVKNHYDIQNIITLDDLFS